MAVIEPMMSINHIIIVLVVGGSNKVSSTDIRIRPACPTCGKLEDLTPSSPPDNCPICGHSGNEVWYAAWICTKCSHFLNHLKEKRKENET